MIHYKSRTYKFSIFLCGNQNAWQKRKTATNLPLIFEPVDQPLICQLATSSPLWLAVERPADAGKRRLVVPKDMEQAQPSPEAGYSRCAARSLGTTTALDNPLVNIPMSPHVRQPANAIS
jgi:hypothetical protein